jgi:sporulation protein YlmC with PRC-barrel domain
MKEKHLDLVRMVFDHQLIDANSVECGKVEDVELAGDAGELRVVGVLTGPGAAAGRLPHWLAKAARKIFGGRVTRVPWEEVYVITSQIKLKSRASELALAGSDRRAAEWLRKLPGAE